MSFIEISKYFILHLTRNNKFNILVFLGYFLIVNVLYF
uniref:Uncharacterized protein n=1 Tax=Polysiphonia sp. TaxID=1967842 RepID=A0A1Z1MT62_9FLOR|nr:hypothetical protein [Polysiphonia sp.]